MPTDREILALAIPALGALIAEPLYVLGDTAIIGHLGTVPLAGLALSGLLLSEVFGFCTFLEYGTTARAARLYGAGQVEEALDVGVQATWLALGLGVLLTIGLEIAAAPAMHAMAGGSTPAAAQAVRWMRIASLGAPFVLVTAAAQGWMRAFQNTRTPLVVIGACEPRQHRALGAAGVRPRPRNPRIGGRERGRPGRVRRPLPRHPRAPRSAAAAVAAPHPGAVQRRARPHRAHRRVLRHLHGRRVGRGPDRQHDACRPPDRGSDLDVLRPLPRLHGHRRPGADRPAARSRADRCGAAAGPAAAVGRSAARSWVRGRARSGLRRHPARVHVRFPRDRPRAHPVAVAGRR